MARKRCPVCNAYFAGRHGPKRSTNPNNMRSLDEQNKPVVAYREDWNWRERWRLMFGR